MDYLKRLKVLALFLITSIFPFINSFLPDEVLRDDLLNKIRVSFAITFLPIVLGIFFNVDYYSFFNTLCFTFPTLLILQNMTWSGKSQTEVARIDIIRLFYFIGTILTVLR